MPEAVIVAVSRSPIGRAFKGALKDTRPDQLAAWMVQAGLFLYDHLARRRRLAASKAVRFPPHPASAVLKPAYRRGFTYADCWVEDSRLVVLNARDAAERVLTRRSGF